MFCQEAATPVQPAILESTASRNRSAQRRRTRRAILATAVELMQQGETPAVNRVAEVADVSRRTVYLYFPSQEQLLTEAAMEGVRAEVEHALDLAATDDIWARVDTLVEATLQSCIDSEVQLRTLIRLSIERRQAEAQDGGEVVTPLRGGRRVEWIETALEPIRERLGETGFARLVSGLAMVVGVEALLVLRDIRGLGRDEMIATSRWAARALVGAALDESVSA